MSPMKPPAPLIACRCAECAVCTATRSQLLSGGRWFCDRGALPPDAAAARLRDRAARWHRHVAAMFPPRRGNR